MRLRRENGKYASYRGSNKSYSQVNPVRIFFITLVTWLKARWAEWDSQDKCKADLIWSGSVSKCKSNAGWFWVSQSYQHVHTSHYTDQQPVDVNAICHFSNWDPEKMHPAQKAEGWKDRNSVLIWTKINFIVFIILINDVIHPALKLFEFFFSLLQFSPAVEVLKFWNV